MPDENDSTQTQETQPEAAADSLAPEQTIGEAMDQAENLDSKAERTEIEAKAENDDEGTAVTDQIDEAPAPKASVIDRLARVMGLDDPTKMPEPAADAKPEAKAPAATGPVKLTAAQEETLKDLAEAMGDDKDPVVVKARERFEAEQREREPVINQHQNAQREQAKQTYAAVAKFFTKKAAEGFGDKYDVMDLADSVRSGKAHPVVSLAAQAMNTLKAAGDECTLEDALEAAHSIYTRSSAKGKSDASKIEKAGKMANGTGLPPTRRAGATKGGDPWAASKKNLAALGIRD